MKFPSITFAFYLGLAAADEGATAWAVERRPELSAAEVGLPPYYRLPLKVVVVGGNTYIDKRLEGKKKSRWAFRVGAVGLQVAATIIAVKRGGE